MNVLIFSTSIVDGLNRLNELNEKYNFYFVLVCNPVKNKKVFFLLRQIVQFAIRLSLSEKVHVIRLLLKRIIKITGCHIHSSKSISWISENNFDVGIHGLNVIYKEHLLSCFRLGILNAHLGLLPQFRGKSVSAWSIIEKKPIGITTFIIDKGIDTGKNIILSREFSVDHCRSSSEVKNYLASKTGEMYKEAMSLLNSSSFNFIENDISMGKRYYAMSNLFTDYVDRIMSSQSDE